MFNYFIFDGHDSRDYGVYISGGGTFDSPARRYENISVPGRDGDLLGASTRLQNVTLTYPAGVVSDFAANIEGLRNMLLSTVGYAVLYDSYHPDEYRYAVYKGGLEQDPLSNLQAGEFEITFECKPQRYLFSGGEAHELGTWGEVTELTGDIVTFDGAADTGIKSLTVDIQPVQAGSGDPSPDNVRPISGQTGGTVYAESGNNIDYDTNVIGAIDASGNEATNSTFYRTAFIPVTGTVGTVKVASLGADYTIRVHGYDASGTWLQQLSATLTDGNPVFVSFAIPSTVKQLRISYPKVASGVELWQGTTKQISFGQTVYGGTDEVVSGSGKKTYERVNLGSLSYDYRGDVAAGLFSAPLPGRKTVTCDAICEAYRFAGMVSGADRAPLQGNGTLSFYNGSGNTTIYIYDTRFTDKDTFKAAVNNIYLVYELATPSDFSTTPITDLVSLYGQNNIWADVGPITLEYGKDPGKVANPTLFDARPVFRVFGYGTLNVGNQTVTIAQNPLDYIDIDSALMDCYCGATNANQYVTFSGNDFPVLPPGVTSITFSNTITQVLVTTNWWRV